MLIVDDLIKYLDEQHISVIRDKCEYDISIFDDDEHAYVRLVNGTPSQILADWQARMLLLEKRWLTSTNWELQKIELIEYLVKSQIVQADI